MNQGSLHKSIFTSLLTKIKKTKKNKIETAGTGHLLTNKIAHVRKTDNQVWGCVGKSCKKYVYSIS